MSTNQTEKFDLWCIVELFGHQKIAGRCTEQNIAGTNMLRVDVPATPTQPPFTRLFGSSAIYAINPVTEDVANQMAARYEQKPIAAYDVQEAFKKMQLNLPAAIQQQERDEDEDDEFEDRW
jgi:hypothetical protein